jgi:hypothetical protein
MKHQTWTRLAENFWRLEENQTYWGRKKIAGKDHKQCFGPNREAAKAELHNWLASLLKNGPQPKEAGDLTLADIGVVLGQRSGGLCSLDIDSDEGFNVFNDLNRAICHTLCTRGARGCNFWWRLEGPYPGLAPLKYGGLPWGEWRADGAQTMIWGLHPNGDRYKFLRRSKPLTIGFADIKWPENMSPPLSLALLGDDTERTEPTQNTQTPQSTQHTERTEDTQANTSGKVWPSLAPLVFTLDQALAAARTRAPGGNHERLFTLARGVKAVELSRGQPLSDDELKTVFGRWFAEAKPHVKKDLGFEDYWFEFMEGYDNVEHPLGAGILEAAWARAASLPPPAVAEQFQDMNLRQVVSLCRELWLDCGQKPFFVSCRTLQRLLGHPDHVRAARWLRGLVRSKILAVVEVGGAVTRKATRYQYLPKD